MMVIQDGRVAMFGARDEVLRQLAPPPPPPPPPPKAMKARAEKEVTSE